MDEARDNSSHNELGFPLTPFGAAGFINASGLRLFLTSLSFAGICALVCVWGIMSLYVPVFVESFEKASNDSQLAGGQYYSGFNNPTTKLGSNTFLEVWAIASIREFTPHTSHIKCLIADDRIKFTSELGYYTEIPYPKSWFISTSRSSLQAFWSASKAGFPFLVGMIIGVIILVLWSVLSVGYAVFVGGIGLAFGRFPGWSSSYKIGMCGCFFGGVTFAIAIILYVSGYMSLTVISAFLPGQVIASICFLLLTVFCLEETNPPSTQKEKVNRAPFGKNPFSPKKNEVDNSSESNQSSSDSSSNPFG